MTSMSPMASESPSDRYDRYAEPPGEGWIFFAGTVMGLAGLMRVVDSIWAFRASDQAAPLTNGLFGEKIENYAWLWLFVGLILIISSFLLLSGSQLARWVGFFAAAVMALSAITWIPYYPVWSLVYIIIAVMVFHALSRYGGPQAT
jgi:hypothetical protein